MIIIGTRFFSWGSQAADHATRCQKCGAMAPLLLKTGMWFVTVFFVIPIIPISRVKHMLECPNCHTRYQQVAAA
jgi:hypothetical protein